jgi:hypothetical protein
MFLPGFARLRRPADARALSGINEDAGDRPGPAISDLAAGCLLERTDDSLAAHDDQVLIAGLPAGMGKLIGGSPKA